MVPALRGGRSVDTGAVPKHNARAYVDDPMVTVVGQTQARRWTMGIIVLVWCCLQGQIGQPISWIGSISILTRRCVLTPFTMLKSMLRKIPADNVVSVEAVKSVAGEHSNVARLTTVWRPF